MHPLMLLAVYLIIATTPLLLGALQGLPSRTVLDEVSSGLAMAAFAILLAEFVLSGRFRLISSRIGMDVTMRMHQLLARTALVFLLVHPFLYQTPFGPPLPWDGTRQFRLEYDTAFIVSGLIAWIILPAFVLMSIYRDQLPYRYETWRLLHGLGAALIAFMAAYHTIAGGRYSADPVLAGFWLLLLAAAIGSLLHTYLVGPWRQIAQPYRVTSVRKIALKTWELTIRPRAGDALRFKAGQFVWLKLGNSPFTLYENPFSISSAPAARPDVQFVIKEAGDMTAAVGEVKPGAVAYLDGPHGNLTLERRSGKGVALIAGGVGVAPLLSVVREMDAQNDPRPAILLYGNRIASQIVYEDELNRLASKKTFQVIHVLSDPPEGWTGLTGQIGRETIEKVFSVDHGGEWLYLVCGPPAMLDAVEDSLVALGVPAGQIVSERFYYD